MPLLSILVENRGNVFSDIKFSCLVNVFLFRLEFFVVVLFSVFCQGKNTGENISLNFLIKKGKVGVWFIIYLMQKVYKFIFFFPKTILFLAMLLLCGRCH